jgi:hypothetical protein
MGKVDQTLFILRQGKDILIVQVYMDDIVFGGSSNSLVARFAEDMSREFEMSMMGEIVLPQAMLTVKFRQPSHAFTFGVGMNFISYSLVLTPLAQQVRLCMSVLEFSVYVGF